MMAGRSDRTTLLDRARRPPGRGTCPDLSGKRTGESAVIVDYMDRRRRKASARAGDDGLVAEIVEALLALGGTAHRDMVSEQVALARGAGGEAPPAALKARLEVAFSTRLRLDRSGPDGAALFALPFGEGSHRWALAREAEIFLRQRRPPNGR